MPDTTQTEKTMIGLNVQDAAAYLVSRMASAAISFQADQLPDVVECFLLYDLHFMRLTGVLDADGNGGDADYDEDEAFEYIFDAYLSDHPMDEDASMAVATLLNRYMECFASYLDEHGLTGA